MNQQTRTLAFEKLGQSITQNIDNEATALILEAAQQQNNWFTPQNSRQGLLAIAQKFMNVDKLNQWLANYGLPESSPNKRVGIITAGNIPLAGWHDIQSVLISGNKAIIKLSSKDKILTEWLLNQLIKIEPAFAEQIELPDKLTAIEAVIATGSNNTSRYFEYYFDKYPHIIRKNRTSVAILTGDETSEELTDLGKDIFSYFGLGCRSVCKLFVPKGYDFKLLFEALEPYNDIINFFKYYNNYNYYKSIYLLNKEPHFDNGFLLVKKDERLASPVSCVYFSEYDNINTAIDELNSRQEEIQCVVGKESIYPDAIPFGKSQEPELWDYADNVDTMKFLLGL